MTTEAPHFQRFVRRVHRRLVAVRLAEAAGIGLLIGSAFAVLFAILMLWLGRPGVPIATTAMAIGIICGGAVGFTRRPGAMQSAMRADRQLGLDDLLSTALSVMQVGADQPWARVVIAAADVRCATLSPSQVVLGRLDRRAWGGVAVAASLAVTLATLSSGRAQTIPGGTELAPLAMRSVAAVKLAPLPGADSISTRTAEPVSRRRTWSDPESQDRSSNAGSSRRADDRSGASNTEDGSDPTRQSTHDDAGAGRASSAAGEPRSEPTTPSAGRAADGTKFDPNGAVATGAAPSSAEPGDRNVSGGTGISTASVKPAPPWRSSTWAADVDTAQEALHAGRVPEAYRDVVRDYFDRQ